MKTYHGSCHCGRVCFEVTTDLQQLIACNCSICTKKGAVHHRVNPQQFRLLSGTDDLVLYQFGTHRARHQFCRHCGIHAFSRPRAAPDMISINVRCLDDYDPASGAAQTVDFDGRSL
ncbi:MAG: GFA family protein [Gammaproteobacteria bacterium]|nr:GFA family protein [Gammaproteobacteria bacterium]